MEIKKIIDNTWCFDEGGVRFFLLEGKRKALLIDAGMETADARAQAEKLVSVPVELILTHADRDHIRGAGAFESFYMNPAEAPNYYNGRGGKGEFIPVWDGDRLDLGDRQVEVIHLPGHTPGGIAILDTGSGMLFSGDPIQKNGDIFMFGPYRDLHSYICGLRRLWGMRDRFATIWPSHADCPVSSDVIPPLIEGARRILDGKVEGGETAFHGVKIRRYDVGVSVFLVEP